jgi:hypothetical protein
MSGTHAGEKEKHMKKITMKMMLIIILVCAVNAGTVFASMSDSYYETFFEGKRHADLEEGMRLKLIFDLTGENSGAGLDAKGFVPGSPVDASSLSLLLFDRDRVSERIVVTTGKADGGKVLYRGMLNLNGTHKFEKIDIDLMAAGLAEYIADGKLTINIFAPDTHRFSNDFRVESARLAVHVSETPLPASFLLFGSGVAGLAVLRKKR